MQTSPNPIELLNRKINLPEIHNIVNWVLSSPDNIDTIFRLVKSPDTRTATNALWILTHVQKQDRTLLQFKQPELIDMLLAENHTGKKRMLLQLLREQTYTCDTIRPDFLDFCFAKINAECEPYAIRAFSIYCAFKMCRFYPELTTELEQHLDMLSLQNPSPGLLSALRTTRKRIKSTKQHHSTPHKHYQY